jgi:hypothetical protein
MGVRMEGEDARFRTIMPAKLFEGRYYAGGVGVTGRTYDVAPDGARFLMIKEGEGLGDASAAAPTIVVVQHWVEELKRLVPRN